MENLSCMPLSDRFWWVGFAVCAMPSLAVVAQPALAVAGDVAYLTRLLALVGQCVGVGGGAWLRTAASSAWGLLPFCSAPVQHPAFVRVNRAVVDDVAVRCFEFLPPLPVSRDVPYGALKTPYE